MSSSRLKVFVACTLFGLAFLRTPLLFDEVFGVFLYSGRLANNPLSIISTAVDASAQGWNQGRFISPLLHLIGNIGFSLSYWTADFFSIDPLTSYGVWRAILIGLTGLLVMTLVRHLLPPNLSEYAKLSISTLAGLLLPSVMISTRLFSSPRSAPWAYTGVFVLLLIFFVLVAKLARAKENNHDKSVKVISGMAGLGFLFGTTYELSQLLAPIGLGIYLVIRAQSEGSGALAYGRLFRMLGKPPSLAFLIFYFSPLLVIRIDSYFKCLGGCYAPANIRVEELSLVAALSRFESHLPWVAFRVGFSETIGPQNLWQFFVVTAGMATALGFLGLWRSLRAIESLPSEFSASIRATGLQLVCLGLGINVLVSLGMAVSQEVQDGSLLTGASSRDSLFQETGIAIALGGALLIAYSVHPGKKWARKFLTFGFAIILSLAAGAAFAINQEISNQGASGGGKFILQRVSQEISNPDFTDLGDSRRCSLVSQKIGEFREWEGHDRLFVAGLNQYMLAENGILFCSAGEEELFANYE